MQPPPSLEPTATPSGQTARSARRRYATWALTALGAAALGGSLASRWLTRPEPDSAVARLLMLELPDANGQAVALARYRHRALILNFWATWCPPCLEEMPELSALAPRLQSQGVQVLGVGIDHADAIARHAKTHPVQYPLLVAGMEGMRWLFDLGAQQGALPWTVLVDAKGHITQRIAGRLQMAQLLHHVTLMQVRQPPN